MDLQRGVLGPVSAVGAVSPVDLVGSRLKLRHAHPGSPSRLHCIKVTGQ